MRQPSRNSEVKGCSLAGNSFGPNFATMALDYAFDGGQADPESGKRACAGKSLEGAEEFFCFCHVKPVAVVGYGKDQVTIL
jgi:hypothetical protein